MVSQGVGRFLALVAGAVALLLAQGCIHLEQTVRLHRNGGCTVSYHYSIAEETLPLAEKGRGLIQEWQGHSASSTRSRLSWFTNEDSVRGYFSDNGLSVRRYRSYTKGGRRHVELVVYAEDAMKVFRAGCFGGFSLQRNADGNMVFSGQIPKDPARKALSKEEKSRIRALCDDLWLKLEVITPTDIIASTAPRATERGASWEFDVSGNGDILTEYPDIQLTFDATGLDWPGLGGDSARR